MLKITILPVLIILLLGIIIGSLYQSMQKPAQPDQNIESKNNSYQGEEKPVPQNKQPENISSNATASLKKLDLSGQGLVKVPSDVFSKTDLEELDISRNKLTGAIPAEIRFLQNLRILDLSDNQMTGVPAEIGQLSKLEVLDLSNNQLTGLPYELGNLKNLKVLRLKGNDYSKQDLEVIKKGLPASVVIE